MLRARSALQLPVFLILGISVAMALSTFNDTRPMMMVLLVFPVVVVVITAPELLLRAGAVITSISWWQVLWVAVFVSGLVFRDRDVQAVESEPVDGWAVFRIAVMCLTAGVLLLRLFLRRTSWLQQMHRGLIAVLAAYGLLGVASCLWSVFPPWTLYKSFEFLVDVAVLAAIVATAQSVKTYKSLLDWTWTLQGLLLASVWLGLLIWPQDALTPSEGVLSVSLTGVMPNVNPNTVGELGAILGVVAACRLLRSNKKPVAMCYAALLMASLLTMCLAQARSGILGFAVGTVLVLLLTGRAGLAVFLAAVSTLVLSLSGVWDTVLGYMRRGETESQLYTLSDRVDWWSMAWPKIVEHPIAGYGAFAGARFLVLAGNKVDAGGIHSDWVEMLVGTGLAGFLLGIGALVGTWWQLIKSTRDRYLTPTERQLTVEVIGVLGVESIRSVFTTDLFWHPPLIFFAAVGVAEFLRVRRRDMVAWLAFANQRKVSGPPLTPGSHPEPA
jgi:O-antigen ligase